ncbi:MAG: peptidoglycan-associated lipoprotein Pal [Candidatus Aminicenantes bacterium]|nr:peptidoglycan-associated lipoprotein Pal [Candidatus Aminicenantes bacterium]
MKRALILALVCIVAVTFATSCKPKVKPTPSAPQVKEQPKVEQVASQPAVAKPSLSEEEVFLAKSLDQINKEKPLALINFDYDKFDIREDAKSTLESNAAWLKKWRSAKILVEGHCDERGTEDYNLALGEKRAKAAYEYLVGLGIPAERMKTISYGKSQPLDMGKEDSAFAKNRRDQFLIIEK